MRSIARTWNRRASPSTHKADDFQAALAKTSFYKDAKAKFGDEAWALLQKYAGNIG